ncbi:MAG: CPXCG motif-containing cysteine-rich protein [Myxococcota bacterium]
MNLQELLVQCPYCSESVYLEIEPEEQGVLVQDCQVCCRPWQVRIRHEQEGQPTVEVSRAQ